MTTLFKQIGTVEILQQRIYPLDANITNPNLTRTEAIVKPGTYPIYSDGYSYLWVTKGTLNMGHFARRGDGMFIGPEDYDTGIEVVFPSRTYGPDEWAKLLSGELATEGDPEQRLRITIQEPAEA